MIFSIFLIGEGKSILSIKINEINNTINNNIILINILKIPFEFPILVGYNQTMCPSSNGNSIPPIT